jgi:hypothetical protein
VDLSRGGRQLAAASTPDKREAQQMQDTEIIFQARPSPEGGYEARALGYSIFTQGDDWEDLKFMLRDAVLCYFDDGEAPQAIRVHLVQNEWLNIWRLDKTS